MSAAVRAGYKQTEVGVIPEDWAAKPLKRISPQQSVGLVINPSTYFDERGTVPMLVGSNIKENIIHWEDARRITEGSNHLISASRLAAGDLVTVRVGDPGLTAVVPPELDRCNCASVMIVRKHDAFDSHWLCSVMNSPWGRAQVANVQYGTAQKQFNISDAVNFTYAVPPLPEQRAIAAALSDVDALLAKLDALIAKKRDLKVATMQQLLTGQTRLPGFSGEGRYKRTELGEIPEDWAIKRLKDISPKQSVGLVINPSTYFDDAGTVPMLVGSNIVKNAIRWQDSNLISEANNRLISASRLAAGDLVTVRVGDPGVTAVVPPELDGCNCASVMIIRQHPSFDSHWLCSVMNSPIGRAQVEHVQYGTAQKQFNISDAVNFLYRAPPRCEQTAIATVLSDMDAELAALEARRDKTRALKQGMMQELLTGRIRLV